MTDPIKYSNRLSQANKMSLFSRRIQLFTWFSVAFAGGYMVFFNDYSGTLADQDQATQARGHVFSDVQNWVKGKLDPPPLDTKDS